MDRIPTYLASLDRSERTIQTYRQVLKTFAYFVNENYLQPVELNDDIYEAFIQALADYSKSTKHLMKSVLMGFYNFYEIGSPARRDKWNKHSIGKKKSNVINFDRQAIEKVLEYAASLSGDLIALRDKAFIFTLADSGFRISEICVLIRKQIDYENNWSIISGKGDKTAIVRISERSCRAIRAYLEERSKLDGATGKSLGSLPLFAQHGIAGQNDVLPIGVDGMRKAVKRRIREAGVNPKTVRIHDFRHYFVTIALIASGNLQLVAELARHETVATTQRYSHLADVELDAAYHNIFNEG